MIFSASDLLLVRRWNPSSISNATCKLDSELGSKNRQRRRLVMIPTIIGNIKSKLRLLVPIMTTSSAETIGKSNVIPQIQPVIALIIQPRIIHQLIDSQHYVFFRNLSILSKASFKVSGSARCTSLKCPEPSSLLNPEPCTSNTFSS